MPLNIESWFCVAMCPRNRTADGECLAKITSPQYGIGMAAGSTMYSGCEQICLCGYVLCFPFPTKNPQIRIKYEELSKQHELNLACPFFWHFRTFTTNQIIQSPHEMRSLHVNHDSWETPAKPTMLCPFSLRGPWNPFHCLSRRLAGTEKKVRVRWGINLSAS